MYGLTIEVTGVYENGCIEGISLWFQDFNKMSEYAKVAIDQGYSVSIRLSQTEEE